VIDDLIVYYLGEDFFRLVVNASTREKDLAWISRHAAAYGVEVIERDDLGIIAVQGPQARALVLEQVADADRAALGKLGRFAVMDVQSTTGVLLEAGVKPAGLGARDTLRLEAGLNLYGQDMDEAVTPYEAALGWTVSLDEGREFIGREALEAQKAAGNARQMLGVVMDDKGVLRHGQKVLSETGEGEILSGTFSPTLGKAIAFVRVPGGEAGAVCVDIRGKEVPVRVVKFPFVREGQPQPGVIA
jgi:aminomethyltransferase